VTAKCNIQTIPMTNLDIGKLWLSSSTQLCLDVVCFTISHLWNPDFCHLASLHFLHNSPCRRGTVTTYCYLFSRLLIPLRFWATVVRDLRVWELEAVTGAAVTSIVSVARKLSKVSLYDRHTTEESICFRDPRLSVDGWEEDSAKESTKRPARTRTGGCTFKHRILKATMWLSRLTRQPLTLIIANVNFAENEAQIAYDCEGDEKIYSTYLNYGTHLRFFRQKASFPPFHLTEAWNKEPLTSRGNISVRGCASSLRSVHL